MTQYLVRMLVRKAEQFDQRYVVAAVDAGADVVAMINTATGDILSAPQYQEFALPYEIGLAFRARFGGARSVLHICGNTGPLLGFIKGCGANALSVRRPVHGPGCGQGRAGRADGADR